MLLAVSLCIPTQAAYANPLEDAGNAIASFFGLNDAEAQAALGESAVADGATYDQWKNYLTDSEGNYTTENIGRIWTDKTVSTESITLSASSAGNAPLMDKGDSDFLVMLSALSSTSNLTTTSNKPLDIVLVLDVSGSMAQGLETYTYTETYNVNTNGRTTYYAKVDDEYVEITRETDWWGDRFDHWELNGQTVSNKTSANDNTEGHIQFYTRSSQSSGSKMNALKTAVNGFIGATAEQNDTINDVDKQHRISIVKYADDSYTNNGDTYGNDFNRDNYNYTQRLNPLTAYNSSNASDLTDGTSAMDGVNDLQAAGATSADYGMALAQRELTENGRDDAVKVVVFFTDGEPNHQSGFDANVANATIVAAQTLKNKPPQTTDDPAGFGALVYSVGVFGDANPNDTSNRFNAFMHGVSSNYPDATTYTNLGERAENSNYYKAAGSSDELNKIFEEIADDVQKAATGSPTEVGSGDPTESGYITFTDTVGDYMKVGSFKSIVYADKQFYPVGEPEESSDKKTLTYKFTGTAGGNGHYAEGDMSDIIITVTRSGDGDAAAVQQGDTVTVKIPATLIPLRNFKVDTDAAGNTTLEATENYPIRIAYGVSLKSGVDDLLKNPDETMQAYINANKSGDNNVAFYSNAFTPNAADGLTSSSFDPSTTNSFYNFTTATPLYTDEACTIPATEIDAANNTYYYKRSHYVRNADGSASVKEEHIALVPGTSVLTIDSGKYVAKDPNGDCYITAGAPRLQRVNDFTKGEKVDPQTGTATNVINPVWNTGGTANYTQINVWLGNNGKLTKEMPGALSVTKNVEVPEGFTNNFANTEFGFSIALMDAAGNALPADTTFDAVVTNEQGEVQGDASKIKLDGDGKYTHKLKDGQTLTVRGLTAGTTYTVTEVEAPAYFDQAKTGDTGAIAANTTSAAVFTNTYNPTDAVMPTDNIKAQKNLQGRAWHEGDTFAFTLTPEGGAPLPEGTPEGQTYKTIEVTNGDVISFGSITFDTPGTYVYEIGEVIPEEGSRLPGISYPQTKYHATVQVLDDGKGALSIAPVTMTKDVSENGTPINPGTEVSDSVAVFTNTYNAEIIEANITGTKNYTDNSGKNPMAADKFSFTATPTGENADEAPVPTGVDAGASFSFGHTDAGAINFPTLKFNSDMDGQSFSYTVTENIPTGAVGNVYQGMTYDPTVWTVTATVVVDPSVNPDPDDPTKGAISVLWSATNNVTSGTFTHVNFTNSYTPTAVVVGDDEAPIQGSKILDGRDALESEDFTFTITGADSATTAAMTNGTITFENGTTATVSNAENGVEQFFGFGDATFTKPGTYTFNINETIPDTNPGGMTYDTHTSTVTVDVVDNNGVLTATVGDYNNGTGKTTDYAAFVNTYRASLNYSTSVDLYVSKTLNGRDMAADEFDFTITGSKDFSETASNKAAGNGVADGIKMLNGITFTQDDAGQTYRYIVDEVDPETTLPSVTYDKTQYAIDVVVADNGNGTLSTSTTVTRIMNAEGESVNEPVGTYGAGQKIPDGTVAFVNTYKASPVDVDVTTKVPLTKEVVGRDWLSGETFSFTAAKHSFNGSLAATELAKMPTPASPITVNKPADNGNSADFGLGNLTFNEAGTYVYRVSEIKPDQPAAGMDYSANTAYITIKIKDNTTTGKLEVESDAVVTAGSNTFTNSFSSEFNFSDAVTFQLSKTLTGHAMASGQFHFTVTAGNDWSAEKIQLPAGTLSADVPGAASADGVKVIMPNGGDIVFNHSATATDSGKTFIYTFSEVIPEDAVEENGVYTKDGYIYDSSVYTLTIVPVMHTTTGKWEITTTLSKTLNGVTTPVASSVWNQNVDTNVKIEAPADFKNFYNAKGTMPVNGTKAITSSINDWPGDLFGFEFTLTGADEATNSAIASRAVVLPGTPESADKPVTTSSATSAADGAFSFGNVTFNKPGNYTFEVSEVEPGTGKPGITYTKDKVTINVAVTDNNDGTLNVEVADNANTGMTFTNTYSTTESDGYIVNIFKTVAGLDAVEKFEFTMTAADDVTKAAIDAGQITGISNKEGEYKSHVDTGEDLLAKGGKQEMLFEPLMFHKTGTYTFNVTEDNAQSEKPANWTYDNHTYVVKLVVSDVDSKMTVTPSVEGLDETAQKSTFTNAFGQTTTYSAEGGLNVTKSLTGRALAADQFTFKIEGVATEGEGGTTAAEAQAKLPAADSAEFKNTTPNSDGISIMSKLGSVEFTQEDIGKTYSYVITETAGGGDGYTNDDKPVTVAIQVLEENNDIYTLTTVTKGEDSSTTVKGATAVAPFNNIYEASGSLEGDNLISVSKTLDGRDWKTKETYEFKLEAATEGAPMPEGDGAKLTIGEPADGATNTGSFGTIAYNQTHAGKEFTYKVTEVTSTGDANMSYSKAEYWVTIIVEDNGDGTLTPSIKQIEKSKYDNGGDADEVVIPYICSFTNTYTPVPTPEKDVQGNNGNSGNGQMVGVGDELTYTIDWTNDAVDNEGKAAAANITITDEVPEGTEFVSAENGGVNSNGTVTWTIENAAANATGTVSFKVRVTEDAAAMIDPITNKAEVQVGDNAPKQSTETTNTVPKKAVTSLDLDNGTIQVGQTLSYVINYRNDETEPATITVTDKVPAGTTFVDGSAGEGVEPAADGTLTWVIEGVEPGASGLVSFQVKVNESAVGATDPITNQATVKIGDRDPGYKTNTTKTTVNSGNLKIAKAVNVEGSGVTAPDSTFTIQVDLKDAANNALTGNYNYKVFNADGSEAQESFMLFFSRAVTGTITNGGTIQLKAGQYVEISGLPEGAQYTVTETPVPDGFTVSYDNAKTGSIVAVADGTAETTVTNTYKVDEYIYSGSANLKVSKTLVGREMNDTDKFTMQIAAGTYTAPGASEATEGFELPMPAATTVDVTKASNSAAAFGDIKFTTPGTYTYTVRELPGSEVGMSYSPVTYTVTITVTDNGDGTLKAETAYDPTVTDNTMNFINSYQEKTVDGTSGAEGTAQVGDKLTYTIKYANTESGNATVVVTDKVPTGTTFVSASEGGTYDQATNTVTWTFNNIASGASGEVTLTVEVSEDAVVETIENQAEVTIGDHDPNVTTKVDTPLGKDGSLVISKTVTVEDNQGLDAAVIQGKAEFTFKVELKNAAGSALAGTYNYTGTGVADGTIANNGTITLKHGQSIAIEGLPAGATYTVTETAVDGFTQTTPADAKPATGTIAAEPTATADFTNHYKVDSVTLTGDTALAIQKTFTGRNWLDTDKFDFTVTKVSYNNGTDDAAKANMPDISGTQIGKPADDGESNTVKLADVTFTKAGTYVYEIAETKGDLGGVTYDESAVTVTITVTDNGAGKLEASVKYGESDTATAAAFTNTYGSVVPEGKPISTDGLFTKVFTGRAWTENDSFKFIIKPQNGAPEPENLEVFVNGETTDLDSKKDGTQFGFGSIGFTFNDIKDAEPAADGSRTKTFEYRVYEEKGTIAGVTYDEHEALLTITVTDNGKGEMSGTSAITAVTRADNSIFTNVYNSSLDYVGAGGLSITKTLDGRAMANEQFGFTVTPEDQKSADKLGIELTGVELKAPAAKDGEPATIDLLAGKKLEFTQADAGKTYSYTIEETIKGGDGYTNDGDVRTVTIEVEDNGNATLTVTTTVKGDPDGDEVFTYTTNQTPVAAAVVPFVNSYYAETGDDEASGAAVVKTTKTLNGRDLTAGEFNFQVKPQAGGDVVATATNDVNGNVVFSAMTYNTKDLGTPNGTTKDGKPYWTLSYKASEVTTGLPGGVSATTRSFDFTVTVVDNGDGTLTATPTLPEGNGFVNTYSTGDPIPMDLKGSKVLDAADGLTPDSIEGKFTFTVEAETEGAPMPESTTVKNDANGNVDFGKIEFTLDDLNKALKATTTEVEDEESTDTEDATLDGEESTEVTSLDAEPRVGAPRSFDFVYTITETGSADGVTNDTEPKTVTFRVTDDGAGKLKVDPLGDATTAFTFTNTYSVTPNSSSVTDQISITKELTGRDMLEGEFTFELVEKIGDKETVVATGANAADGKVTFASVEYTEPGEHDYLVREVNPGTANGVTYDARTFRIHTSVTDNGKGALTVTHVALDRDAISFVNTYEPAATAVTLGAAKVLEGAELADGQFTFQILDKDGKVVAEAKNDANGKVIFPDMKYTEEGTHEYTVVEKSDGQEGVTYDTTSYKVTVTVTDDKAGHLVAGVDTNDTAIIFKNTYTAPEEPAKPGDPEPPALPDTSDTFGPLVFGLGALAVIACAGLVVGAVKMSRKTGSHRMK